uniref:RING-type domain-containing protein n=1 Tax=Corethron hystrix TaxID=216773 RepID=A0A6U5IB81_9STRA|mmetsp:Transcript_32218/g.74179  ORF Transcript_32218/g.74179 Transcript_32218/m.74179 type:complete len:350 (+) Transcript_32218:898-1947(+)|eukprot:CAMPEP_0113312980 /NCGR_PEP_ID=MMETSP0010_2-20120614/9588_1 /TAXON_ID=216773 ORGANISM="Corethron hystrix, Strain 308" /NCGR_SAMPLE_ID=MMETSP0010_2 /ASSEMBLY_ACC=CAM_ASM_000155 /LENGTH=349 /DNA_ID=CAMNT_0000168903 /DNA_START=430 /DNA_END=1479 /DNA_ORIENTATION=- /assembly_acc=CAM_ASM_000155
MAPAGRRRTATNFTPNLPTTFFVPPGAASLPTAGSPPDTVTVAVPDGKPVAHPLKKKSSAKRKTTSSPSGEDSPNDAAEELKACAICQEVPSHDSLAMINKCEHLFCFECIEKWAEHENTCPLCKERFTKIERVNKPPPPKKRKAKSGVTDSNASKQTKRVRRRDQRSEMGGINSLHGLFGNVEEHQLNGRAIASLPSSLAAQLIFSGIGINSQHAIPSQPGSLTVGGASSSWVTPSINAIPQDFLQRLRQGAASAQSGSAAVRRVTTRTSRMRENHDVPQFGDLVLQQFRQSLNNNWTQVLDETHVTPRSYATNSDEINAGVTSATALEIDDSDEEDGVDEVVVIQNI